MISLKAMGRSLTRLFFLFLNPLFDLAAKRPVEVKDLPPLPSDLDPRRFYHTPPQVSLRGPFRFLASVLTLSPKHQRGVPDIRCRSVLTLILMLSRVGVSLLPPFLLHHLLLSLEEMTITGHIRTGVLLIVGITAASLAESLVISHYFYQSMKLEFGIANVLSTRIFSRSLRLTRSDMAQRDSGQLLNFISGDTKSAAEAPVIIIEFCHDMLVILFVSLMLFAYLGPATIAPIFLMLLLAPVSKTVSNRFARIDNRRRQLRDQRISLLAEFIQGIRTVKYMLLEKKAEQKAQAKREAEVRALRSHLYASVTAYALYGAIQILSALTGFGLYMMLGNPLSPAIVFPCLALFKMLEAPFGDATHYIASLMGTRVALRRIFSFFKAEPFAADHFSADDSHDSAITIQDLSVHLGKENKPVLRHVDLEVKPGEKVAVVGAVGSGKTVLLETLAGEIPYRGRIRISGSMDKNTPPLAYVPQTPVIFNGPLRDNITLGRSGMVPEALLKFVCLEKDLARMHAGLDTEIGENGINLSGGQRQRVSIARAAFSPSPVVLMDDPFSAVDEKTESQLVENLFGASWRDRSIVMATHRFACLERMDRVVFLKSGAIAANGSLKALLAGNPEFAAFYHSGAGRSAVETLSKAEPAASSDADKTHSDYRLMEAEDRVFGRIGRKIYGRYLKYLGHNASGSRRIAVLGALFGVAAAGALLPIVQDFWLTLLASPTPPEWLAPLTGDGNMMVSLWIYGGLGALSLLGLGLSHLMWLRRALSAAVRIHSSALRSMFGTHIRFFDSQPAGRIINRFSRDMDEVDTGIGDSFKKFVFAVIKSIADLIFIAALVPFLIPLLPILAFFSIRVQKRFLMLTRELKRLYLICQTPVLSFFKQTLSGVGQIRCYGQGEYFAKGFCRTLYQHHQAELAGFALRWWYHLQNGMINSLLVAGVAIGGLVLVKTGHISTALAGVALTYALMFIYAIPRIIDNLGEVQNQMASVERLFHYCELSPEETRDGRKPGIAAPMAGEIEFHKVDIRYDARLPRVIKDLSFVVPPRTSMGIMGRTGAGKTTLFQALFRFLPLAGGKITIDGMDISEMSLKRLRRAMAVVPQESMLFDGSIRENLDPIGGRNDPDLKQVLVDYGIWDFIGSLPQKLDTPVQGNGDNLSLGQRQLICLARAVLRDTPILLLDEATASIDPETEQHLQQLLANVFKTRTVLVIAHRSETMRICDAVVNLS